MSTMRVFGQVLSRISSRARKHRHSRPGLCWAISMAAAAVERDTPAWQCDQQMGDVACSSSPAEGEDRRDMLVLRRCAVGQLDEHVVEAQELAPMGAGSRRNGFADLDLLARSMIDSSVAGSASSRCSGSSSDRRRIVIVVARPGLGS